jgi:flagellar protein FlaG
MSIGISNLNTNRITQNYPKGIGDSLKKTDGETNKVETTKTESTDNQTANKNQLTTAKEDNQEAKNVEIKKKELIEAISKASGVKEIENKSLSFSIHEKTNQIMIKVIDSETKEVIKEVPSKKILDMMAKMIELSGSYIDERR